MTTLHSHLHLQKPHSRWLGRAAGLLAVSAVAHLVALLVTGGGWEGAVSFRKPITFSISFGLILTLTGLDWAGLEPGARLRIGPQVEIEVTDHTTPCEKNASWFIDGDFTRMSQRRYPGSSRIYARVLRGGPVATGDKVELAP